ncbi:glycerol-3-phosphate 1-O-acyltransferase [Comamonadaceae bacterium OH2310_COT-174]|nr:glycerol-3-phosphate 1-O-acyltransferase [Comamonadaceae bacterium OH2310_COT-174]
MDWMVIALALLGAYLLGSLPFAVLVSRAMGLQDPRTFGSGNPGATNVLRSGSKLAAALTLLLDAAKGWLPVALVGWYGPRYGLWEGAQAFVGLVAFAGHVWPLFLRFRGGKGVATALGVLLGLSPWLGLAVLLVWLLVLAGSRISSLSSIVAAIAAPVIYVLGASQLWPYAPSAQLALIAMTLVLLYRHGGNISRLMKGTEPRIGQGKQAAQATAAPAEPGAPAPSAAALRNARKAERKKHKRTRHSQR